MGYDSGNTGKKGKEGVEVRFMYDGMCSIALLPYPLSEDFWRPKAFIATPLRPLNRHCPRIKTIVTIEKSWSLTVHTAFTGGVNLADEYINVKERFGYWKDVAVMIKGRSSKEFHDHVFADVEYLGENAAGL